MNATDRPSRNLDCIPYDVFYQIASRLGSQDLVQLGRVNGALNRLVQDENIARKAIENELRHTTEGQEAIAARRGYRRALGRVFDIREAFATAQPYSASLLAYGSSFLYSGGALTYIYGEEIRILNVHEASRTEQVLNLHRVLARIIPACDPDEDTIHIRLMQYHDWNLAFTVELEDLSETWLVVVDMRRDLDCQKMGRLRFKTRLLDTRRLFVRLNTRYVYWGTHSMLSVDGHLQWVIECADLQTGRHTTRVPLVLDNFSGHDIAQTVCFGVYDDHLYAVSTMIGHEAEEIDWTSYYVWLCVSPTEDTKQSTINFKWRRQHREGPVNDTWSDLSLRVDEATKQLLILECRREWINSGSENIRTYYMQALPSPAEIEQSKQERFAGLLRRTAARNAPPPPAMLPDEPLTRTLDSSNKPRYEPPQKRIRRHYHQEYPQGTDLAKRRDFILARTKYRTYNLSSSTFVDLVTDSTGPGGSTSTPSRIPTDQLRLRLTSRKRKSPIDTAGDEVAPGFLYPPELNDDQDPSSRQPIDHSEERFESLGVHMWPPDNAPPALTQLLSPTKRIASSVVRAAADERSLVYSVDAPDSADGDQAILLINFDPLLRLPGLLRLDMTDGSVRAMSPPSSRPAELVAHSAGKGQRVRVGDVAQMESTRHTSFGAKRTKTTAAMTGKGARGSTVPSVREEGALYLRLGRGFWLR
ncbi:F-box domain protein [Aspergillus homomorphus CBS 101889]|uniref:F-box domain protein n=1 Tax=Aspergillus homomorphus (strain CBS 101889) TaxID=1450537 RepID=A0A395HNN2_ASPHC|nr:F-box domain protein [Aspergillus homomorphus CBS 101889]RAL09226.1 F-box domain protein [Aspergillus homomorphus CBS 101889]